MPDYVTENGELRESHELIHKRVKAYLDKFGANIPILHARDTPLGQTILNQRSAVITYTNLKQVHAHIRAALWQYVNTRLKQGRPWKLDYVFTNSIALLAGYLGSERLDFTGNRLVSVPLLIVEAPTWQRHRAAKDHAAILLQQRMGMGHSTIIYSNDYLDYTVRCANDPRAYSSEFTEILTEHADIDHIVLDATQFRSEIKDLNGCIL